MMKRKAKLEEGIVKVLMIASAAVVIGSLALILTTVIWRGLPALDLAMVTQTPKGGFYLGKEGGILNAIVGSLYLAGGATVLAVIIGLPIAIYLQCYAVRSRRAEAGSPGPGCPVGGAQHRLWGLWLYDHALAGDEGFAPGWHYRPGPVGASYHGEGHG